MSNRLLYDEAIVRYEQLRLAVPIRIDNVAEYYLLNAQDEWHIERDAPNLAPPFEEFWMEWEEPETIVTDGFTKKNPRWRLRTGLFFRSALVEDTITKWDIDVSVFSGLKGGGISDSAYDFKMNVTANGEIPRRQDGRLCLSVIPSVRTTEYHARGLGRQPTDHEEMANAAYFLWPGILAISFMHCKNVDMIENVPPILPMTNKRAQHPPRTKYYTLNIRPMQRILEDEGHISTNGLKQALHICRGHFKDYRDGAGLFGRYKGMYWWESQVRGDKKYGEVHKNYRVLTQ